MLFMFQDSKQKMNEFHQTITMIMEYFKIINICMLVLLVPLM